MKISEAKKYILKKLNLEEAFLEAELILEAIAGLSKEQQIISDEQISQNQLKKIDEICEKRAKQRIPLAYLLEEAHFFGMKFFVNSDVLIPRPETEILVELVLKEIKKRKIHHPTILDLCTGSGCIAVAIKRALPAAKVYASDISKAALNVAAINAQRLKAEVDFVMGDYLDPFLNRSSSPIAVPIMKAQPPYFDVIVSNPPYVSEADYQKLEPELFHEPKHALIGFPYELIAKQGRGLIKEGGFFAFEYGQGQSSELKKIFPEGTIHKDLAGIDRVIVA